MGFTEKKLEGRCRDAAGQGEARVSGLQSEGIWLPGYSTWVEVEEYSGTSSVVEYSMHILDFNQRRDE